MNILLDELMNVLEDELRLNESMLSVLDEEREALTNASLEQLEKTGLEKESILNNISIREHKRKELLSQLCGLTGNPCREIHFQELTARTPAPLLSRLTGLRENLLISTNKLRRANEHNRMLLSHSLELVRGTMSVMNNLLCPDRVYYNDGRIQNPVGTGRMVSGEI